MLEIRSRAYPTEKLSVIVQFWLTHFYSQYFIDVVLVLILDGPLGWRCFPVEHRVGRITGRLPQELADQIVENVLELFRLDTYIRVYIYGWKSRPHHKFAQNECHNIYWTLWSYFRLTRPFLYSTKRNWNKVFGYQEICAFSYRKLYD